MLPRVAVHGFPVAAAAPLLSLKAAQINATSDFLKAALEIRENLNLPKDAPQYTVNAERINRSRLESFKERFDVSLKRAKEKGIYRNVGGELSLSYLTDLGALNPNKIFEISIEADGSACRMLKVSRWLSNIFKNVRLNRLADILEIKAEEGQRSNKLPDAVATCPSPSAREAIAFIRNAGFKPVLFFDLPSLENLIGGGNLGDFKITADVIMPKKPK